MSQDSAVKSDLTLKKKKIEEEVKQIYDLKLLKLLQLMQLKI